ncbi:DUF445 domain-containing protein [Peribacillus glennii]|uniref:DUF445 domain-containing protein n=1 Tax=Peribacillus glennii TaxID=2303991 RepID=A0A372LCY0_9BACI|nr:DUF445 domain-containing protein [Peribacillus glennii]RFU63852.1 DUF445 domain-containing protein [Peribacillus glennii]
MANKSKHLAGISLAIMGTGFVATLPFQGNLAVDLLQGGFEAGVVGGLADWFAVTALFRHPMGLPIPHTALLPKNRKRVTKALVNTLENDWLSQESIQEKIKQIHISEKIISALEKQLHTDEVKKGLERIIKEVVRQIKPERFVPYIEEEIKKSLSTINVGSVMQQAADQALARKYEEKAFDAALQKAEEWLMDQHRRDQLGAFALRALNNIEGDGILQFALKSLQNLVNEEKLGKILQTLLLNIIYSLRYEKDTNRQAIMLQVRTMVRNLGENKPLVMEIENLTESLVSGWQPAGKIIEVLQKAQQRALEFAENGKLMDDYFLPFITGLLHDLKTDNTKMDKIENWVQEQITILIAANHSKIGKLVEENLDKLENETLIDMVENNVGKDLQWIRVNGAVCGFIIGLVLTGFKAFF